MSGRSAYVRAKTGQLAERKAKAQQQQQCYGHNDDFIYGISGNPATKQTMFINVPYASPEGPSPRNRRHSVSSGGSTYTYMPTQPRPKPRPIIIASAIERSDFRTHLDGMSKSVRGKLGRLIKGGDDNHTAPPPHPALPSAGSDSGSRSTGFTPSVTAVPSLEPGTPPGEEKTMFSGLTSPTPTVAKPRHHQQSTTMPIRRFEGGGKGPQPGWKLLSNNPELWDDNGDTYVYMYMRGSKTKPPPSFRISSTTIYESGSRTFIAQLRDRSVPPGWPRFNPSDMPSPQDTNSADDTIASIELPRHMTTHSGTYLDSDSVDYHLGMDPYKRPAARSDDGILHEIYIAWPGQDSGVASTLWHITSRNFFAVLCDADSLIGTTLYEAFFRLYERLESYPEYLDRNTDKVSFITDYILRHKFDDVRNNPSYAASLLAFSELPDVQWREGYIEGFVHCVGMLNMGLKAVPEWRLITPHTKMFIHNASLELEERVHRAQNWLFSFEFTEMWPTTSAPPSASHSAFDRLRKWLCKYYEKAFLHWPPTVNDHTWLTHDMVVRLRKDFYGLYDYLVDRDVMFDGTEYRPGQKWALISTSGQLFRADTPDLALTDILLGFDDRHGFPHIPHPYPHTPTSVPVVSKPKSSFHLKKPATQSEIVAQSRRKALSYSEASNVYTLRNQYMHTDLVTNFIAFEQTDMLEHVDPFEARRGRWILIYGILQVLATVSVDSPNLRYRENVQYHLSPQMKGVVPWAEPGIPPEDEASHKRSHCWLVPNTWARTAPKAKPGSHKPIIWGQYGDGRSRAESEDNKNSLTKMRDTNSIGRMRAEEWVHNTAAGNPDLASEADGCTTTSIGPRSKSDEENRKVSNFSRGASPTEGSFEDSNDSVAMAVRRRRAQIHGFTDFQVPAEW